MLLEEPLSLTTALDAPCRLPELCPVSPVDTGQQAIERALGQYFYPPAQRVVDVMNEVPQAVLAASGTVVVSFTLSSFLPLHVTGISHDLVSVPGFVSTYWLWRVNGIDLISGNGIGGLAGTSVGHQITPTIHDLLPVNILFEQGPYTFQVVIFNTGGVVQNARGRIVGELLSLRGLVPRAAVL